MCFSSSQEPLKNSATLSEYDLYVSRKKSQREYNVRSELDLYLEEDVLPRTPSFDVLGWW